MVMQGQGSMKPIQPKPIPPPNPITQPKSKSRQIREKIRLEEGNRIQREGATQRINDLEEMGRNRRNGKDMVEAKEKVVRCCCIIPVHIGMYILAVLNIGNLYGLYVGIQTGITLMNDGGISFIAQDIKERFDVGLDVAVELAKKAASAAFEAATRRRLVIKYEEDLAKAFEFAKANEQAIQGGTFIGLIVVAYIPVIIFLFAVLTLACGKDKVIVRKTIVCSLTFEILSFILQLIGWPLLYMVVVPNPHWRLFMGQFAGFGVGVVFLCWWRSSCMEWVKEISPLAYEEDWEKSIRDGKAGNLYGEGQTHLEQK